MLKALEHLADASVQTLDREIASRRELRRDLVGTLYPSVLSDEIAELCELRGRKLFPREAQRT